MVLCWFRRTSWGFPLLELAWCTPDPPSWFCQLSKWRAICCFVKLAFFAKLVSKMNSLRGQWMPETCCNGSSVAAPRKQGIRWNVTVLIGNESIGSGVLLPSSSLRCTLIVTQVISWKLNVEQDTLGLRSVYSDVVYCSYLGSFSPPSSVNSTWGCVWLTWKQPSHQTNLWQPWLSSHSCSRACFQPAAQAA